MTVDLRPVIQAGVEFHESWVTPDNPRGFHPSPLYRLDRPECVPAWWDVLTRAKALGVQGVIFWQPAGYVPGRPQYLVESHLVPPDVLPQLRLITAMVRELGLWCGSMMRPGELSVRTAWDTESSFAFDALTDDVQRLLFARITGHEQNVACDGLYLDSFGLGDPDAATVQWLRSVDSKIPLFVEHASDRTAPYAGAYAEWSGINWTNYGPQLEILRWMFPDMPIIAHDRQWRPWVERCAWGRSVGVAPLFLGGEVPAMATAFEAMLAAGDLHDIRRVVEERMDHKHAAMTAGRVHA